MSQQICQVCRKELHSIITVPFGNSFICRDCNMLLRPLLEAIADGIIMRADWIQDGIDLRSFVIKEIEDNFAPLISQPNTILQILK